MEKVVLIGAGGHCRNIISFFQYNEQYQIYGITDPFCEEPSILGYPVLGPDELLQTLYADQEVHHAFVAVGSTGDNSLRAKLFMNAEQIGFALINIVHPASIVSPDLQIQRGNLIMPGCIVNSNVSLGDNNILNTGAIIEHDVRIGSHVHIAPRAVLGGGVRVGDGSHVGIGATVLQGVQIGIGSIVGAGAVVIRDLPNHCVAVGVPARVIKTR